MTKTLKERTTEAIYAYEAFQDLNLGTKGLDFDNSKLIEIIRDQRSRIEELEEKVTNLTKVIKQQKATNDRIRRLESQEVTEDEIESAARTLFAKDEYADLGKFDNLQSTMQYGYRDKAKAVLEAARKARLAR